MARRQPALFETTPTLPEGFRYQLDFLSVPEEQQLLSDIATVTFNEMRMRGVVARRRVAHYGWNYSFESFRISPGPEPPAFLLPLRARAAAFAGLADEALAEALIMQYPPGATIGWHRDAPPFGVVIGISLAAPCTFKLRRESDEGRETITLDLQPRSLYVLDGPARTQWQHSITPTKALRYSITFRSLRKPPTTPHTNA